MTRMTAVSMTLALLCLAAVQALHGAAAWYFLPNFQQDVRGVERPSSQTADAFSHLPPAANNLLSPDSPLTEKQRSELRWHPVIFPVWSKYSSGNGLGEKPFLP